MYHWVQRDSCPRPRIPSVGMSSGLVQPRDVAPQDRAPKREHSAERSDSRALSLEGAPMSVSVRTKIEALRTSIIQLTDEYRGLLVQGDRLDDGKRRRCDELCRAIEKRSRQLERLEGRYVAWRADLNRRGRRNPWEDRMKRGSKRRDSIFREYTFELRSVGEAGDGFTLEGYAAVFDSPTRISGWEGDFTETVQPGAFKRTLQGRKPVLMFNHGKHPTIGDIPIGVIVDAREDQRGLYVKARLATNDLVAPVREAIVMGAITGMSFRFEVIHDSWTADRKHRTLTEVKVPELGPVVFPAYAETSVAVRDDTERGRTKMTRRERQAGAPPPARQRCDQSSHVQPR